MKKKIKTIFYGDVSECHNVKELVSALPYFADRLHEAKLVGSWDDFEVSLVEWNPDLAIVLADGAAGMEGVYLVRARRPELPVIWFSDDQDFGMQSHRLECVYFSAKPITSEKMQKAVRRYSQMWV